MRRARRCSAGRSTLRGRVVRGEQRGRTLGFPTANLHQRPGLLLPADGVYAVRARLDGRTLPAVLNIGVRPTFGSCGARSRRTCSTSTATSTGAGSSLELVERLRGEQRFTGPDALRQAIAADVARAREVLAPRRSGRLAAECDGAADRGPRAARRGRHAARSLPRHAAGARHALAREDA